MFQIIPVFALYLLMLIPFTRSWSGFFERQFN